MLRLLADENFNNAIVRGVRRRKPDVDLIRVQDVGLSSADDPTVLAGAADEGRVLLINDVTTITKYAYVRIAAGEWMPGVIEVSRTVPIGIAIENIVLLVECSTESEWEGQILYLPL